jgi:hypothetical protein
MKVTTRKKEYSPTTFGELPAIFGELPTIGVTFRYGGVYYMNIHTVILPYTGRVPDPNSVNAVCLNNGVLNYIQPGELIEIVEAELMVITND